MYAGRHPSAIGIRDVLAAWIVCLAVAAAGLLCPELASTGNGLPQARAEPRAAPAAAPTGLCAIARLPRHG